MRKVLSILLLGFVMLAGSRMSINLHYCGGKLASVEFFAKKKDMCVKCGMKKSKTCCQDVSKVFDSDDHRLSTFSFDFAAPLAIVPESPFPYSSELSLTATDLKSTAWANAPPHVLPNAPIYILYHTLIV